MGNTDDARSQIHAQVLAEVARMRRADDADAARQALVALATGDHGGLAREHMDSLKRGELLEVQWELEDILDETAPVVATPNVPAAPEPEPEPEPQPEPEADQQLTSADLNLVYDDPRGLLLHKTKVGDRWFATQVDQSTGQPQTFELHAQEIAQLKMQLQGSPYWLVGG